MIKIDILIAQPFYKTAIGKDNSIFTISSLLYRSFENDKKIPFWLEESLEIS